MKYGTGWNKIFFLWFSYWGLNHACHMLLFADTGELVTTDHDATTMADDIVVLDIDTGEEQVRVASGSPLQSVVFPAPGWHDDIYYTSFSTVARIHKM